VKFVDFALLAFDTRNGKGLGFWLEYGKGHCTFQKHTNLKTYESIAFNVICFQSCLTSLFLSRRCEGVKKQCDATCVNAIFHVQIPIPKRRPMHASYTQSLMQ
jgi:hypothetical protein